MTGLYIGSTTGFAGKNLLVVGIGLTLHKQGYKIGYMKPVGTKPAQQQEAKSGDEDAFFIQNILGLEDDMEIISPVLVTHDLHRKIFSEGCPDLMGKIQRSYELLSRDKDLVLVCGSGSYLYSGKYCNVSGIDVSQTLGLNVILIDRFFKEFSYDYILSAKELLGDNLIGTVFNNVPDSQLDKVENTLAPMLERSGVPVLGTIPEDSLLNAIKVGDLSRRLGGKIISVPGKSEQIVENFLIGTMQVENFMTHFRKKQNTAVIVGGDRSDLQLVALEGKCPCLILTGNLYPNDIILTRSEVLGIPIIVVREDTYTVAKKMESILETLKLRETIKINHGAKLVESIMNWEILKDKLKLKPAKA